MSPLLVAVIVALSIALTGCNEPAQMAKQLPVTDASGNVVGYAPTADAGSDALTTGLAAGAGAAIGSVVGNAISNRGQQAQPRYMPSAPGVRSTHSQTIIRERVIIKERPRYRPQARSFPRVGKRR